MKKKVIIGLFLALALIQLSSPLYMIVKREIILKDGMVYRFKTIPIDPYDAFRGRYIALRIKENRAPKPQGIDLIPKQKVYAELSVDENGYAAISRITIKKPKHQAFLKAKVSYFFGNKVILNMPLDRYYMEEKAAQQAEKIYREHSRRGKQDAYIVVRLKDGFPVIVGLYVGGKKIESYLKK